MAAKVKVEEKYNGELVWKFCHVTLDPVDILEGFRANLLAVCKPEWNGKAVKAKVFGNGITNTIVGIYAEDAVDQMVLVRINGNGTEVFIKRDLEITCMLSLYKAGFIPPVYCQFINGLCYGYQPGKVITLDEMADLKVARYTAKCFAQLHSVPIPSIFPQSNRLFEFYDWLDVIDDDFGDEVKNKRFTEIFGSKGTLRKEVDLMKATIGELNCPLVFSHNDTLAGNVIYDKENNKVSLIDFEYGGPNIRPFDVADHFCEFVGIDIATLDWDRYPKEDFQKQWIKMYLEEAALLEGKGADSVTSEQVDEFYKQVGKCALAAHLFWTIWSLLQAQNSAIDFDYMEYAGIKFAEYRRRKQAFLSL